MTDIAFRPSHATDAYRIQLRPEDASEVSPDWREHAAAQAQKGTSVSMLIDGEVVALGGIAFGPKLACPWLLCSKGADKEKWKLLRVALGFMRGLHEEAREYTVGNYIGKNCPSNRAFVERLGFQIIVSPSGDHDFFYLPKHV